MDLKEKLKELNETYTLKEIASMFNVSCASIYNWINGKSISKRKKRMLKEKIDRLYENNNVLN